MHTITYLAWQMDKHQPLTRQIVAALRRFEERCGCAPTELLAPSGSGISWSGLEVHERRNIPAGQVWIGADLNQVLAGLVGRTA